MKVLIGDSRNLFLIEAAGELIAGIEVVLVVSEPEYSCDESGIAKKEKVSDFRFHVSVQQACDLAEHFLAIAKDARGLENRIEVKNAAD